MLLLDFCDKTTDSRTKIKQMREDNSYYATYTAESDTNFLAITISWRT